MELNEQIENQGAHEYLRSGGGSSATITQTSHQNNFRFLALYMDMRCFESVTSKVDNNVSSYMRKSTNVVGGRNASDIPFHNMRTIDSDNSNLSSITPRGNINEAKEIALTIFEEYLKYDARYYVRLEPAIRTELYKKFGYIMPLADQTSIEKTQINSSTVVGDFGVNVEGLMKHLNQALFHDVYIQALESLDTAFDQFKKSLSYAILREDIKRQEKLFQVMIEGGFVMNT